MAKKRGVPKTRKYASEAAIDAAIFAHLPRQAIKRCYLGAPGKELREKFVSPESSAALAANAFGLFVDGHYPFRGLPSLPTASWPALDVRLEGIVRFPWSGGRHPCLDVLVETDGELIGIESKRYEPFRHGESGRFSPAYSRKVWGPSMARFEALRDSLNCHDVSCMHLDTVQLAKHAFGLRTAVHRLQRLQGKRPVLYYLYAEPRTWPDGTLIPEASRTAHRSEVDQFGSLVAGDEVAFHSCSYDSLLTYWESSGDAQLGMHATAIRDRFSP